MKNKKNLVIIFIVVLACAVSAGYFFWQEAGKKPKETSIPAQDTRNTVWYQDKEYEYNSKLTNILFMGIDKTDPLEEQETPGTAGQADCILLISLDRESKEARILQISRETMTDIDLYDVSGEAYSSVKAQLALQYAYAKGEKSSNWAMKKAVSRLLYDLPIDGTISMNIEGIRLMNDAVGGVTLKIPEDYTVIDPAFGQGETVTLTGEQAERYVRYRDTAVSGSNNDRMKRQTQYIPALLDAVKAHAGGSGNYYDTFEKILEPYVVMDLSAAELEKFAGYKLTGEAIYSVPGEVREAEHDEFYTNDEELYDLIIKLFYKSVK